jgi:spore maturation protein CgeB
LGRALRPEAFKALFREGELQQQQYREAIWRSRINLSFLTHSNQDEFVHKSFEIADCGGFPLAERSEGICSAFKEDEEAVFFTGFDEVKIRRYLPDEAARQSIAAAGNLRGARDGY